MASPCMITRTSSRWVISAENACGVMADGSGGAGRGCSPGSGREVTGGSGCKTISLMLLCFSAIRSSGTNASEFSKPFSWWVKGANGDGLREDCQPNFRLCKFAKTTGGGRGAPALALTATARAPGLCAGTGFVDAWRWDWRATNHARQRTMMTEGWSVATSPSACRTCRRPCGLAGCSRTRSCPPPP